MSRWAKQIEAQRRAIKEDNLWRSRRLLNTPQSAQISADGRALLNFSSNDYLGLANDAELIEQARQSANRWGVGSGASHLVSGHLAIHHQLEEELADFVGAQKAVLFSSGYMANIALPSAFFAASGSVYQDKLNHASLIDGALLAKARARVKFKRYRHADAVHLGSLLSQQDSELSMIVTDGVFSMDGDVAPLKELSKLASQHQSMLVVDDAHAIGLIGENGQGSLSQAGLAVKGDHLLMGTLGKAFGSFGAFVAGDSLYIEHLVQKARSYIYTTALPPTAVSASLAALHKIKRDGAELRTLLGERVAQFKQGVEDLGLQLMESDSPIQPLLVGSAEDAMRLSQYLLDNGVYVPAIRPPTVPQNTSRLRFTFSASHKQQDVARLLECLANAKKRGLFDVD